jgi:hypothetical protein
MKTYAVLDNDSKVTNLIIANSLEIAETVTSSYCALVPLGTFVDMGYSYSDGVFSAPAEEVPAEETPAEEAPA